MKLLYMDIKLPWQKIMRVTLIAYLLLISAATMLQASPVKAQVLAKRLTVNYHNTSLHIILNDLQEKTKTDFGFTKDLGLDRINIEQAEFSKESLKDILNKLLKGRNISFKEKDGVIILFRYKAPLPGKVSGKIVDEKGEALPGATIKVLNSIAYAQSGVDGSYVLSLPPGTYTLEITYVSFLTSRITDVVVNDSKVTPLTIIMKADTKGLSEVVITASYKKASVEGLYAKQKNNAAMTDGISAEQIRVTPDNNTAQVLKRISGLTVQDEKFVTVRGLSERYNNVTLNGAALPSTEPNRRNFAFDIIPAALVDNIVVSKTATPDQSAEFAGGLVQVTTRDIPDQNYFSFTIGSGINTNSTGEPFYGLKRGLYENFGFADKDRIWWTGGKFDTENYRFLNRTLDRDKLAEVSRTIPNTFGLRNYGYQPVQNLQLAVGRRIELKKAGVLAITAAASSRHEESIANEQRYYPGYFYINDSLSRAYNYNSALAALGSIGWQIGGQKIIYKALYNRRLSNTTTDYYGQSWSGRPGEINTMNNTLLINGLWHNRLEGEHRLSKSGIKLDWSGDLISLSRDQPDNRVSNRFAATNGLGYYELDDVSGFLTSGITVFNSKFNEKKKNAALSLSLPFKLLGQAHKIKMGYAITQRNADTKTLGLRLSKNGQPDNGQEFQDAIFGLPDYVLASPDYLQPGLLYYKLAGINGITSTDDYTGSQRIHAGYLMGDFRLMEKLRLVGGLRLEKNLMQLKGHTYNLSNGNIVDSVVNYQNKDWLPSINMTYNLTSKMNIRAAWSKTLARADFRERSTYKYYDANERAIITGAVGLKDAYIYNADLRFEYFPAAGEILSFSVFYKKFRNPVEMLSLDNGSGDLFYYYFNLESALNKGIELDFRKSIGFIAPEKAWLQKVFLSGNGSWMKADVTYDVGALLAAAGQGGTGGNYSNKRSRPLQGLSPYVINGGLGYFGEKIGVNLSYNRFGGRIAAAGSVPYQDQYENPRDVLDLQISGRFMKKHLEARLNIGDLFQQKTIIYQNVSATAPVSSGGFLGRTGTRTFDLEDSRSENTNLDPKGKSFNKNLDYVRYSSFRGRNITLNLTYNF